MEPISAAIAVALAGGLVQVGGKLIDKGVLEPALEPATDRLKKLVQHGYQQAKDDEDLLKAVQTALAEAGAPADDEDALARWLKGVGLDRLTSQRNDALRRQVARAVLAFTDPEADPPHDLMVALGWPRSRRRELSHLLTTLRAQLYTLEDWRAPIEYVNDAARLGLLGEVVNHLNRLDNVFVETPAGEALRVVAAQEGLTPEEAADIETRYRADLVRELRLHDFRGIVQMRRDIRLPLADIYLELGLLSLGDEEERRRANERLLTLREAERLAEEERRLQERVSDALVRAGRLVILGEPGAGKTISLRFITLMLAHGYGAARLGLDALYIPLMVRLADFARELEKTPALSLDNFLLGVVEQAYASHPRLGEYLRLALEKGACMALLDGLDEVGDDPVRGQSLRTQVVSRVQQFADRWCTDGRKNRVVVTSRIEGYWDEALHGFAHVQLSPLNPPDEVREFLLRWYTAHERAHDASLPTEVAEARAEERVAELLPCVLEWPSVRRLATNPLLLTILALIHENVGRLPNRRIKLYEIAAQTLIESWRQAQTGMPSELLAELGEEAVIRVMAPLAYWLHQEHPGGTASFQEWRERLLKVLAEEGYEAKARKEIAERFLHHARYQAGLLAERGLGQFGFFHLTFEEYLAARQIARQRAEERREMLKTHWEDPRWQEVILLAAGQLGIVEARRDDVSDFVEDLLKMEAADPTGAGRPAVLAGRALADIGARSVTNPTRRWVLDALLQTMQDLDPETERPNASPYISIRTRYAAGEVLDELGWLPPDLNAWVCCLGCAENGGVPSASSGQGSGQAPSAALRRSSGQALMVMKYPLTNAQYERFIRAGGYENPDYWGGEDAEGWQWRIKGKRWLSSVGIDEPEYWQHPRFGKERRGYPVVGISWYEAGAYAAWLTDVLRRARAGDSSLPAEDRDLVADLLKAGAAEVRLLTEEEWVAAAGGTGGKDRYTWDPPAGPATKDAAAILARANTAEAELGDTSPVAMYPLGASQPWGVMDLAGNVWEWTNSWYDEEKTARVVRGGSWGNYGVNARVAIRDRGNPNASNYNVGVRLASPVLSS
jgi:formylglycine-generating enzyme required for sulfatase activity